LATALSVLVVHAASAAAPAGPGGLPSHPAAHAPFAVGERVVTITDPSRTVQFPGQPREPRRLVTVVRYPAVGPASRTDVPGAAPDRAAGPFPLLIFGHGFEVTPAIYAPLLEAWARAGYVVAAPIFPLGNENAPGGPDEGDLINQPGDMSVVITRMIEANGDRASFFYGLIDRHRIAVAGHSDGGDTALAVAYDHFFHDRRVRAAVILSGMEIPGVGGFDFPSPSPPLLATQGTADTINPPYFTRAFFDAAPTPKYLLQLLGAAHIGPYSGEHPQLGIVERVTIAFLDGYLNGDRAALRRMTAAGNVPGVASLEADR
jgi:dienelactone hydrolase